MLQKNTANSKQIPVIMDVDTGVDDALALALIWKSKQVDLVGVTTVNGNVSLSQATLNTRKVMHMLQQLDVQNERSNAGEGNGIADLSIRNVPIIPGANEPLMRSTFFEHAVHGNDGLGGALSDTSPPELEEGLLHAAQFIIEEAKKRPGELTLLMTAPLTNLAIALRACPELPQLVKRVVVMGGAVQTFGNVTPVAEYNIYVDPEAAKMVLHAGFDLTLVGLDVTRQALLRPEHLEKLDSTPLGGFVRTCTAQYMERYRMRNGVEACAMHDPLAAYIVIDTSVVKMRRYYVDVETRSDLCDGQTVCDVQNRLGREPNANVCVEVDGETFMDRFISVLQA
ncbi:nucleoside hydrolase [Paenibacillus alvei]|uniref:Nucleoside hydrolase n=1 Tax=Paenibacillus alvei TaxID=44250 RepID=A0ABT4GX60_PAEAL|nr:nucleoside hydrolase [Paenibacillus alvei]EJW19452.1 putative nucleosidase [Paenibacillus alvei DSM 29]MCY9543294.1 nucleoside hydrolase [Paenibacillus alvei]MCY9702814.1 nucleoside hydrolase [Paenibacillus alvei]MCY9736983.1 nucleoside hydrolase [Paenibacillus alvei]MCY9758400.1 nucleoside hydrolase [Paenibacillus alvei]